MKITFIHPWASLSGGLRVVSIYARELMELGHEVSVVSHDRQLSLRQRVRHFFKKPSHDALKTQHGLLDFLGDNHVIVNQDLSKSVAAVPDGDIVIATWWQTAEWVYQMPASKGRKFYLLQDYEIFEHTPETRVVGTYRLPLKKIAVSNYIQETIAQNHDVHDIKVVRNSVDTNHFNAPMRARNRSFTVGFMYSKATRKQVRLALDAVIAARAYHPELKVVVFGANAHRRTVVFLIGSNFTTDRRRPRYPGSMPAAICGCFQALKRDLDCLYLRQWPAEHRCLPRVQGLPHKL